MENRVIARIFDEIADFLEIKGENPFKIRSYRKVAEVIRAFPGRLEDYVKEGGDLRKIEGIGEAIEKKIMEIIQTGDCNLHRRLLAEMPYSLLSLLRVPGMGPKTVGILYSSYGIKTVEELKNFLKSERAKEIPKFGPRKIEKILRALERVEIYLGKFTIEEAEEALDLVLESVEGAEAVGSFRRFDEMFDDLDIIYFAKPLKFPWPKKELEGKVRFYFPSGIPVDFFDKARRGVWKIILTGPGTHWEWLKQRAEERGFKLNEDGLFLKNRVIHSSEEEIYHALGLEWIPPEIRHLNPQTVPPLVEENLLKGDLHVHTDWTDGKNTLEDMVNKAHQMGYGYMGISDHSASSKIAGGLPAERLLEQVELIRRGDFPIRVLASAEVDILEDGRLDYPDLVLSRLDYVVASPHLKLDMGKEEMTRRLLRALENPYVKILGHPTGRLLGKRPPAEADWDEIFKKAAQRGVAIEINSQPQRLDLPYHLAEKALRYGVYFAINTDAHSAVNLERLRKYGIKVARKAALPPDRIINTWEADRLIRFLKPGT